MKTLDKITKLEQMLNNRCTAEAITELNENEVFVFGSKPDGNHDGGAAKIAVEKFGAKQGMGEGLSGQSYAIPVHRYRIEKMADAISRFIEYASTHPEQIFYILPIGCGKAGMNASTVAEMFESAIELDNIYLPFIFIEALKKILENNSEISSYRYHGRWYGLMFCLGEQSGRNMKEKLKDKASSIITMLEISDEFPNDIKYVSKLIELEDEKKQLGEELSEAQKEREFLLGAVEAKRVYLDDKNWKRLLVDRDIK